MLVCDERSGLIFDSFQVVNKIGHSEAWSGDQALLKYCFRPVVSKSIKIMVS